MSDTVAPGHIRQLYERIWTEGIQAGHADFGDLATSLRFLELAGFPRGADDVVEIGSGIGTLCHALYERGCWRLIGVDISQTAVEFARRTYPHLDLRRMDAGRLEFPAESFDVCLSFDVIEHLASVAAHFNDVFRVLKPGGRYMFQTPNRVSNSVFSTISYRGLGWRKIHCSLQSVGSLRRHIRCAGFAAVEFVKVPVADGRKKRLLPPPFGRVYASIPWEMLPLALQTNYYVVAHKRSR